MVVIRLPGFDWLWPRLGGPLETCFNFSVVIVVTGQIILEDLLVLFNDLGFEEQINNRGEIITSKRKFKAANEIHLKYMDDLSIAENNKVHGF